MNNSEYDAKIYQLKFELNNFYYIMNSTYGMSSNGLPLINNTDDDYNFLNKRINNVIVERINYKHLKYLSINIPELHKLYESLSVNEKNIFSKIETIDEKIIFLKDYQKLQKLNNIL